MSPAGTTPASRTWTATASMPRWTTGQGAMRAARPAPGFHSRALAASLSWSGILDFPGVPPPQCGEQPVRAAEHAGDRAGAGPLSSRPQADRGSRLPDGVRASAVTNSMCAATVWPKAVTPLGWLTAVVTSRAMATR